MKKRILLFVVILAVVFPILPVWASQQTRETLRELERQLGASRGQVSEAQSLLSEIQGEMSEVVAEMQRLDQRIVDVSIEIEDIEMALMDLEIRIEDAEYELGLAQAESDQHREVLRYRLRAMHEMGQVGLVDALFQATSFADFVTLLDHMRTVAQFDQDLLMRLEDAERRVFSTIDSLNRDHRRIEDLHVLWNSTMQEYETAHAERAEWLYALAEDEAGQAMILAIFEEEQRALQSQVNIYQRRYADEVREQERLRRIEAENARLAHLNNFNGSFAWPVPASSRVTSPFGRRYHPITRRAEHHTGIDIGAPSGTRIIAAADGYVRFVGWSGGYGNTVIIDHGNGYSTLYAHNSRNRVTQGQRVNRGDHIADVGSTGMSTGPHLHFEIRRNNVAVNPASYLGL